MSNLKDFQERFINSIQSGKDSMGDLVTPGGQLNQSEALQVYRSDYYARLQDALGENYEAVWTVVGDEDFYTLGQGYIRKYPSDLRDLTSYGEFFVDFLKSSDHLDDYPFLIDLASFERVFWSIFHTRRESYEVDWTKYVDSFSELYFSFSSNLRIFSWNYKVKDIFEYRITGFTDPDFDFETPQAIMLYKSGRNITIKEISPISYLIIKKLMEGKNLLEVIDSSIVDLTPEDIQSTFSVLQTSRVFFPKKSGD